MTALPAALSAHVDALARAQWLAPDTALDALEPDALAWVEARLDEHAAAITPYLAAAAAPQPRIELRVERSWPRACAAFASGWAAASGPDPTAHRAALAHAHRAARTTAAQAHAPALREAVDDALAAAGRAARESSPRWAQVAASFDGLPPAQLLAALAATHALAHDAERACPWTPLLALWMRGAWPLVLPGFVVLVYVPLARGDVLVADPERPDARAPWLVPRERPPGELTRLGLAPGLLPARVPTIELAPLVPEAPRIVLGALADVGRAPGNSAVVRVMRLARRDALFVHDGADLWVLDEGTSGGQFVDNERRNGVPTVLRDGSVWSVNPETYRVVFRADAPLRDGAYGLVVRGAGGSGAVARAGSDLPRRASPAIDDGVLVAAARANAGAVRAELEPLARAAWFAPDERVLALDAETRGELEATARAFLAQLAPDDPGGPTAWRAAPVEFERSVVRTWRRWNDAWQAVDARPYDPRAVGLVHAVSIAAHRVGAELDEAVPDRALVTAFYRLVAGVIGPSLAPGTPWSDAMLRVYMTWTGWSNPVAPGLDAARLHLAHLARRGTDARNPSPFAPLLALHRRGVTPLAMPGSGLLLYVPVVRGGALVLNPDDDPLPSHYAPDARASADHFPAAWLGAGSLMAPGGRGPRAFPDGTAVPTADGTEPAQGWLATPDGEMERLGMRTTLEGPSEIVWRRGAFWLVQRELARGFAVNVSGATFVRPLAHGDALRSRDVEYRFVRA